MSDDDTETEGKVISLRPSPADPRDEGEVTTIVGFGKVVEFRQPPSRAAVSEEQEERLVFQKKRRWKWTAEEQGLGFSVRCGERGEHVVIGIETAGLRGVYELWLPLKSVHRRPGERDYSFAESFLLMDRLRRVVQAAEETQEELRRAPAKRETLAEAVGMDGLWTLVRCELAREHNGRKWTEVFFEVTGGNKPKRVHSGYSAEYNEKHARADFDEHKPAWKCGAEPPVPPPSSPTPPGWRRYVAAKERCGRRRNHEGHHRNRNGQEWPAEPAGGSMVLPLPHGE